MYWHISYKESTKQGTIQHTEQTVLMVPGAAVTQPPGTDSQKQTPIQHSGSDSSFPLRRDSNAISLETLYASRRINAPRRLLDARWLALAPDALRFSRHWLKLVGITAAVALGTRLLVHMSLYHSSLPALNASGLSSDVSSVSSNDGGTSLSSVVSDRSYGGDGSGRSGEGRLTVGE